MGEVRLLHHILLGEPVPDDITDYCVGLVKQDHQALLEMTITSWNKLPMRNELVSVTSTSVLNNLSSSFHHIKEQATVYGNFLLQISQNLVLAKMAK